MDDRVDRLREWVQTQRKRLLALKPDTIEGRAVLDANTRFVDRALREVYAIASDRARASCGEVYREDDTELSIIATGGYGRRELSPFSDIDIAFVPSEEDNPYVDAIIKEAFRLIVRIFLDSTDLSVGYAFRPLSDIPGLDHRTKTALLDSRWVAGNARLPLALRRELARYIDPAAFLQEWRLEWQGRDSPSVYTLEPNVKDGPGGLRDAHAAFWAIKVMYHLSPECGDVLSEMEHRGVISPSERQEVEEALEMIWRIRNWLHIISGKKNDVLVFDMHCRLAKDFGFGTGEDGVQALMAAYYRHAQRIRRFAERVHTHLLHAALPLGDGLLLVDQRIDTPMANLFDQDPLRLFRAFEYAGRYGLEFGPRLDQLVETRAALVDDGIRGSRDAARSFLALLRHRANAAHTLRKMARCGLLQRYLPEVGRLMPVVPRDRAHMYTVGEHALRTVECLSDLTRPGAEHPEQFVDAMFEIAEPEVLMLAALLHDVAKADPDEDHAVSGARVARSIGMRFGLDVSQVDRLERLVRDHLLLMRTARLRDLSLPVTIRQVAETVGDPETLKMLYLLSYADAKAVGDNTWTSIDMRLLDELYVKVRRVLAASGYENDLTIQADRRRDRVRRELRDINVSDETVRKLCEAMPVSYILNTSLDRVATHIRLLDQLATVNPVLDFYNEPGADFTELTVSTYDDPEPGMLSKIAGTLFACGADISKAQIFTMEEGERDIVLDILWISMNGRQIGKARADRLTKHLMEVLSGRVKVEELIRQLSKAPPQDGIDADVRLMNDLSEEYTVVHVAAPDLRGLLYLLTKMLAHAGLRIHSAKIATSGDRAEDAFYVTRQDGTKVCESELAIWERDLCATLDKHTDERSRGGMRET